MQYFICEFNGMKDTYIVTNVTSDSYVCTFDYDGDNRSLLSMRADQEMIKYLPSLLESGISYILDIKDSEV